MKRWIAMAIAGGVLCIGPVAARYVDAHYRGGEENLSHLKGAEGGYLRRVTPPPLTGLKLAHIRMGKGAATAPAHGKRVVSLTVVPQLQKAATRTLAYGKVPKGSVVMLDVRSGRILAYANQVLDGPPEDLAVQSRAPAASVFKIVTGSSLVEKAHLKARTKQCYWGGLHGIRKAHLKDDPRRDKRCVTIATAMGRSTNVVFARLSLKHLQRNDLYSTAKKLGFGSKIPFDTPVEQNKINLPDDDLGFARTSAGFWNTTLSPLSAAVLAATVANKGMMMRPYIVQSVRDKDGLIYRAPSSRMVRRALSSRTARQVQKMMETAVPDGTCFKTFHDRRRKPFLPGIKVAGKTGTLIRQKTDEFFTWFAGYAPANNPEVAIAVLANNSTKWRVKANWIAREMLRYYFALKGAKGVRAPRH